MSLEVWLPEGIHEETEITVSNGQMKEIRYFPYKMFHLDIFNEGNDDIKVMINAQSLPNANTLKKLRGRKYDAKHPKYWRVALYAEAGNSATIRISATR